MKITRIVKTCLSRHTWCRRSQRPRTNSKQCLTNQLHL